MAGSDNGRQKVVDNGGDRDKWRQTVVTDEFRTCQMETVNGRQWQKVVDDGI